MTIGRKMNDESENPLNLWLMIHFGVLYIKGRQLPSIVCCQIIQHIVGGEVEPYMHQIGLFFRDNFFLNEMKKFSTCHKFDRRYFQSYHE